MHAREASASARLLLEDSCFRYVVCGFGVWVLGFEIWGLGFGVWSLGFGF